MNSSQTPYGAPPPPPGSVPPFQQYAYPPPPYMPPSSNGNAIAALVLGIASIPIWPLGWILGPLAIIFAGKARREIQSGKGGGEGLATAGKVTGIIGTIIGLLGIVYIVVMIVVFARLFHEMPFSHTAFEESQTISHMESLADALDKYESRHKVLPEDTELIDGEFSDERLLRELADSLISRYDLKDGWDRPLVYDRLQDALGKEEMNTRFGYDKSILRSDSRPMPMFVIWSKGDKIDDPSDDIFFVEGRGIVRPKNYVAPRHD